MNFDKSLSEKLKSLGYNVTNINLFIDFVNQSRGKAIVCFKGYGNEAITWERDTSGVISGEASISSFGRNFGLVVPVLKDSHLFYFNGKVLPVSGLEKSADKRGEEYEYLVGRVNPKEVYVHSSYFDNSCSKFLQNNGGVDMVYRNGIYRADDMLRLPSVRGIVIK